MSKFFVLLFILPSLAFADEATVLANIEKKVNMMFEDKIQLSVEKETLEKQIDELQQKIRGRKKLIVSRLRAMYSLKKQNWFDFFSQEQYLTLDRNLRILNNLNKYDFELFKEYNLALKQLGEARKNLLETDRLIEQNIEALQNEQQSFYEQENKRLSELRQGQKSSLLLFKGKLSRPLDGNVVREFGTFLDKQNQFYLLSHGELYSCKEHTPIRAIGPGQVIFRDALADWRETLIIQHDDQYYSVYAGVEAYKKNVGDHVDQDELIGSTSGKEFYFELRHFDIPINPKDWFKK